MKTLNLKVRTGFTLYNNIKLDGKKVKFKKDSFGNRVIAYQTENDSVDISIINYLEINNRLWFLTNFIFFIISFFGLFDARYDKSCRVADCHFVVKLQQDEVNMEISYSPGLKSQNQAVVKCESEYETLSNIIYVDQIAKKRYKLLKIFKILFIIVMIAIACLIVYLVTRD